mgnify:CR=1 FL=1
MRLTMRNHKSYTYRASLIRVDNNCAIGDIVDKLGRYEDICDDPERLKEMVKEKSIRNSKSGCFFNAILWIKNHKYSIANLKRKSKEISGSNPLLRLDKSIKFE